MVLILTIVFVFVGFIISRYMVKHVVLISKAFGEIGSAAIGQYQKQTKLSYRPHSLSTPVDCKLCREPHGGYPCPWKTLQDDALRNFHDAIRNKKIPINSSPEDYDIYDDRRFAYGPKGEKIEIWTIGTSVDYSVVEQMVKDVRNDSQDGVVLPVGSDFRKWEYHNHVLQQFNEEYV